MKPLPWLAPLVPIYAAAIGAKNRAYDRGALSANKLKQPVISIGNISTGGNGKTPVVIAMAQLLRTRGISVDVLSRGYGRSTVETLAVPADKDADADQYGDEPLMIARATGVPVFVGASRYDAGLLAERTAPAHNHVHLLDDGFQHRQLARDLDVAVFHASDVTARLLPAGSLREPLSSLTRAQAIVVREEDRDPFSSIRRYVHDAAQVWYIRRTLICEVPAKPVVAFCGIARPGEFFSGLRKIGIETATAVQFGDHHRYTEADLQRLLDACRKTKTDHLVTTEKDAVRLGPHARTLLNGGKTLSVAKLETTFLDPDAVHETVRALLQR